MVDLLLERLPELEDFPPEERTAGVKLLLRICHRQQQELVVLREEVRVQAQQIQILREQNVSDKSAAW